MKLILIFILFFSLDTLAQNTTIKSFANAKSALKKIYGKKNITLYCRCKYQAKSIKLKSCKINTKKFKNRKKRLEWEHVVPAHAFGQSFKRWRHNKILCKLKSKRKKYKTPRKCAQENAEFRFMESDLYNLVPSVGAINAIRNKHSFAEFRPQSKELCSGFYFENRKVLPPNNVKGDIARIYLYMDQVYPGRGVISRKNKKLFHTWDKLDPVTIEECVLYKRKKEVQKSENQIMLSRCKKINTIKG